MGDAQPTKTIKSVERSFDIIESLVDLGSATVSEIAEQVEIPVSTAYIHLSTLQKRQYIVKSNGEYRLSFRFLEHGGRIREKRDYYRVINREINEMSDIVGEPIGFAVEERGRRVIVYRTERSDSLGDRAPVGEYTYMHWTSLGKAILAFLPKSRVNSIIDHHGLPHGTSNTITDRTELYNELDKIHDRGYALDDAERFRGIRGVAVPILNGKQEVIGSLGIAGAEARLDENYISYLIEVLFDKKNVIEVKGNFRT